LSVCSLLTSRQKATESGNDVIGGNTAQQPKTTTQQGSMPIQVSAP
jgi:hypothetical protein